MALGGTTDLSQVRAVVLSAFYWGYILSQVPGSTLAQRYGGKVRSLKGAPGPRIDTCHRSCWAGAPHSRRSSR